MPYDLFSPRFKRNPYPTFATMRTEAPVYAHKTPKGQTIWYVTRYHDVLTVLKDYERFVKDVRSVQPSAGAAETPNTHQAINQNMLFADPPNHTRLRALINQAFTSRRVAAMAPRIQAIADELLDQVQVAGQMDLMTAYALPLPVVVIAEMLGIPAAARTEVFASSQAIISPGRHRLSFRARRRKVQAFIAYLRQILAQRQRDPHDDLITALVQAEQAGDKLTEMELSSMVALLLVTGHETVVNLIGNGLLALLKHPQQLALLKADPGLIAPAIEELLRFDGPVETSTTRWARTDLTFHDQAIQRGDVVRAVIAAANRDPAIFSHPDQLDLTRQDNRHLGFGQGIHYCLGAPLARLEAEIALLTLLQRLPNLRLAVPPNQLHWHSGTLFRGLQSLPVRWGD
jgi:cytochrome P450